jgi:hypothetical protein
LIILRNVNSESPRAEPLRLAMWSGPRNISTAMMRSWENRPDTIVCDEPFYAHYLAVTHRKHPGADAVIAYGPVDADEAVRRLLAPLPEGKSIFFQKHMVHHLLPDMNRDWLSKVKHCFLIRDPVQVIASFAKHVDDASMEDLGYVSEHDLFEQITRLTGEFPPVLHATDVLQNPRGVLTKLCERLGIPFMEEMLHWPPGPRATDGVWAKYWYKEVESSTGFHEYQAKTIDLPPHLQKIAEKCEQYFQRLYPYRIKV